MRSTIMILVLVLLARTGHGSTSRSAPDETTGGAPVSAAHDSVPAYSAQQALGLVPLPVRTRVLAGKPFRLAPHTRIVLRGSGAELVAAASFLAELLRRPTGFPIEVMKDGGRARHGDIVLGAAATPVTDSLGAEGYRLDVVGSGVSIRAATGRGVFWGIQTFRQLLPPQIESRTTVSGVTWSAPSVQVTDHPRFRWRGLHLDVSRHFFGAADVKRLLDLMALHKLTTFHWHLTDSPGWRIEIRKWPDLTRIGAWRDESPLERDPEHGDGKRYGGFYTQAEIREIVDYARRRFIDVVPEIEMPGHAAAAICAYPRFGCHDAPGFEPHVESLFGWNPYVFAPTDSTLAFLQDVLAEVVKLVPGEFVHLGGEEVESKQWFASPSVSELARSKGLDNAPAIEAYMMNTMHRYLARHHRRLVGWEGIQEGGLARDAVVMCWREEARTRSVIASGYDVVLTPPSLYLDRYQGAEAEEPPAIGGFVPLDSIYSYDPVPAGLDRAARARILGIEGLIWTEHIGDRARLDYMAFPRVCALSEVAWSAASRNWEGFRTRLDRHLVRLDTLGVRYRHPWR